MIGKLQCVVLDCPDAPELARFYQEVLGGVVNQPDPRWSAGDGFTTLHLGGHQVLAFQRAKDHQAPKWPDPAHPQQSHLDIEVPDLDAAQAQVLDLGAALLNGNPGGGWRVFADPVGHPFCLVQGPATAEK